MAENLIQSVQEILKEETWTTAYGKIADYMAENADKIKDEIKNG